MSIGTTVLLMCEKCEKEKEFDLKYFFENMANDIKEKGYYKRVCCGYDNSPMGYLIKTTKHTVSGYKNYNRVDLKEFTPIKALAFLAMRRGNDGSSVVKEDDQVS